MNPTTDLPDDDWLERALRDDAVERRAEHVDDAGFTARVMAARSHCWLNSNSCPDSDRR